MSRPPPKVVARKRFARKKRTDTTRDRVSSSRHPSREETRFIMNAEVIVYTTVSLAYASLAIYHSMH